METFKEHVYIHWWVSRVKSDFFLERFRNIRYLFLKILTFHDNKNDISVWRENGQICKESLHKTACVCMLSHSAAFDSLRPHGLLPVRLLCILDSAGKNTLVGCQVLLQGIFLTQGLNPCLLLCRWIPYL